MSRFPRLPLTIFERAGVAGHQRVARDHLAYCDLVTDSQQRAYDVVREHHALSDARVNHRNSALSDALRSVPKFDVGDWAWVYNTAATIRQGTKSDTDAKVLKAKLTQLDGPLQSARTWPLLLSGHPGRICSRGKAPVFASSFRYARR